MTAEQLWVTARRLLGVYFVVMAAVGLPSILTSFGAEAMGMNPWVALTTVASQCGVYLLAGWWLLHSSPRFDAGGAAWPRETLIAVLQVIGVYFIVHAVGKTAAETSGLLLDGVSVWRIGRFTESLVKLAAGLWLAVQPGAIAEWLAEQR